MNKLEKYTLYKKVNSFDLNQQPMWQNLTEIYILEIVNLKGKKTTHCNGKKRSKVFCQQRITPDQLDSFLLLWKWTQEMQYQEVVAFSKGLAWMR